MERKIHVLNIFAGAMWDFCLVVYGNRFLWVDEDVDAVLFHLNAEKVKFGRVIVVRKHGLFLDLNVSRCFRCFLQRSG